GRAVRGARRAEPRYPADRAGAHLGRDAQDRRLHHSFDRGSAPPRRPLRGDDRATRPYQADHRRPLPAPSRPDRPVGGGRFRQAQDRHLAGAGGRGQSRARGDGSMTMSAKTRDRLLYLISPIAFLIMWELLLRAGIGDRRFIPTPSDVAVRFWVL